MGNIASESPHPHFNPENAQKTYRDKEKFALKGKYRPGIHFGEIFPQKPTIYLRGNAFFRMSHKGK